MNFDVTSVRLPIVCSRHSQYLIASSFMRAPMALYGSGHTDGSAKVCKSHSIGGLPLMLRTLRLFTKKETSAVPSTNTLSLLLEILNCTAWWVLESTNKTQDLDKTSSNPVNPVNSCATHGVTWASRNPLNNEVIGPNTSRIAGCVPAASMSSASFRRPPSKSTLQLSGAAPPPLGWQYTPMSVSLKEGSYGVAAGSAAMKAKA
mmetsp:Transcript_34400/g.87009  ORF Transcript_34400/g.87009 Transcript_34400/m.87009 type:complete len:204 (+) Transcript_34400:1187-1798(+)